MSEQTDRLNELTADIVAAYVSRNVVAPAQLPELIHVVHAALASSATAGSEPEIPEKKPAVPIKKSVTPDAIICLEDGKSFKSLKRHLMTQFGLTPAQYREKWGLAADYPMVAPNYAATRSAMAKGMGLGKTRASDGPTQTPPKRGRPKKLQNA